MGQPAKEYTRDEVAKHKTPEDLWVIIDSAVYDLTSFAGIVDSLLITSK